MATATTSCAHSYKRYYLLLTILLFVGVNNAWAGAGFWNDGGITLTFTINTSSVTRTLNSGSQGGETSLGTVTTAMTLKSVEANVWKDGNGNICTVNMFYQVKNSSGTVVLDKSGTATALSWSSNDNQNQVWQNTNIGVDLMNGGLAPGTYTFECWFTATGNNSSSSGCGTTFWYSNNSNNYKYTFIIPSKKLTVSGAANGNTVSGTVTGITKGKAYTIKATPTTGYSFSKWTASSGAASITIANANLASTTVTFKDYANDATVTASFKANQYTVTLDNQGATTPGAAEVIATYKAAMPSIANNLPKKTGYDFGGYWTVVGGTGTKYYNGTGSSAKNWDIPNNTTTLYAHWKPKTCTIKFNLNNGEGGETADVKATYDQPMPTPITIPTRRGYTFSGYFDAKTGGNPYYNADGTSARNWDKENGQQTLYAQWTPNTYTVQFNANGGEGSMDNQEFTYDAELQPLVPNTFTKAGCTFSEWNTAADGSGTSYANQQQVSNLATEGTITLYAQWSTSNCKWLETDIANIESDDEVVIMMAHGKDLYALPYKEELASNSNPMAEPITLDNFAGTIPSTLIWYIVKNESNNFTLSPKTARDKYLTCNSSDNAVRINTGENRNFTIENDFLKNTAFDTYLAISTTATPKDWRHFSSTNGTIANKYQTLKLYKKVCLDENNYWVTWNAGEGQFEDGKSTKIKHYQEGAEITPPTPTRIGYNLTGWSPILEATMPAQNMTYTAQWELKTTTITLAHQGGTGGTEITATYSQPMPPITPPTRTGYDFQGYFSSNGGTGTKYYNADGTSVTTWDREEEKFTLIAYWTAKTTTVSFNQNGGTGGQTDAKTATYDQPMPTPITVPSKEGHTFLGYYDATTDGTKYYNADGSSAKVWDKEDASTTLYAQWQVNQYDVTWNPNEGNWHGSTASLVVSYDYGATINKPEDPVRGGWVFNGWDPTPATTMPANHLEYTAQWGKAYCEGNNYTFHTGTSDVWNNPAEQDCFERKEGTETEWQIRDYTIPEGNDHTHFLVAYQGWPQINQNSLGGHSKSVTSTWSATMYLAPAMDFSSAENSPKVGHAAGARGTLRIFDDSSWDNLCVGFIPDGYMLKFGADEYEFMHYENTEYRSEIVEYNSTTANNNVSVGIISNSDNYVKTDHTQEGMRHIFVRDNIGWMGDEAKVAIYYWSGDKSGWSGFLTKVPGETNLYVGLIPVDYTSIKLIRYRDTYTGTPGSWNENDRWNATGDITMSTSQQLLTITDWNNQTSGASTYKHKGKFRIYNDSRDKNWYVHFYPHYVITFDKNAADAKGTMPPQALPLDADPKTIVLNACAFERRGYDFAGWKTDVAITADGANVAANGNVKDKATISNINKDITLKAQWKAQAYTITYKDQGDVAYSGENEVSLPQTHTYDQMTTLVAGVKTGYTFGGWYTTPECVGTAVTELGAQDYIADITLYAKWTFAMEYNITNTETETIFITSAVGQKIKATTPLTLEVSNMPVGTTIDLSAGEHIHFYYANKEIKQLTNKYVDETFELEIAYKPEASNTTEKPSITLNVLGHEKVLTDRISCRSLPNTFAVVAKVGGIWYALPSQGLNSTTPPAAYPVEVDNMADPTAVTAVPANADWSLRQVYEAIRIDATKDRFVENGENFVFVNNEGTPKAINASVSGNYLLTDAQYSGYYETNPGLYEWTPTTSDLETYTLTNAQRTERTLNVSINTVFGVHYDNKATTEVRFLPIAQEANRYTTLALQVVEWKENSVVIMYNGDPAQIAYVSVNGGAVQTTELSGDGVPKDIAVYELTAKGLATNPTQSLSITIGTEKAILPIPYIVSGDLDDATLLGGKELTIARRQEIAKISDLVILNGGSITAERISSNYYKFRNVTIYGGGSLIIPADKGFGANSLTMRVGGVENCEYVYTYPQLDLNGTINSGNINLDLMTTNDYYYPFSVPYEVTLTDIHYPVEIYGSNVKPTNKGSFLVSYYDGEERAKGNSGWKDVEEQGKEVLSPHVGYSIWGLPKKVSVNGATSERQTYGIHRIPMKKAAADVMVNETTNQNVSISAYNATRDNDKGWNFIGNPYLVQHGGLDGNDTDIQMGLLEKEIKDGQWTGGWVFNDEQVRYVTQTNDCLNYTSTLVADATIPAFSAFFIQAAQDGAIAFTSPNMAAAQSLTARRSDENKEITTGIILSGEKHSDCTGLLIADKFTEAYEFNADLSKFDNQDMNLYTIAPSGKLAFMAINEELAKQTIPLGYSVSTDGMYTIAFDEQRYHRNDIYALYLIDYHRNETTNLLHMDYNFYSETGTHAERFALQVAFAPKTPTDVEYTQVGDVLVSREGNTLRLDNLPSDATVTIYDAVGHLIEQHSPSQHLQVNLPTGYYLLHVANKQNAIVIDTFIP